MHEQLAASIADRFPVTRSRLEDLIRIPSVSAPGFDPAPLRRSAEAVAGMYEASGLTGVRLLEPGGAPPAVFADLPGPADGPTVLLYAHHDVQPAGEGWTADPFEPVERDGRLYARGSSDDKSGVVLHAAALEALGPPYPVAIKIFIEGEEECGSPHLELLLEQHGPDLAADVIVVADTGNFRTGLPSFTTSLRGLVDCVVEVRTKRHAVHSGSYGGVFPDALTALARLLATLHDEAGRVAIARLVAGDAGPLDLSEEELRAEVAAHDTLELIGHGSLTSRLWQQPALSVLAIDAPRIAEAVNALIPVARAKISLRLAPGQDPEDAFEALRDHLVSRAPWGAEVGVTRGSVGHPFALETGGPGYRAFREGFRHAWNREPVEVGVGGSIPFVAALAGAYPDAEMVLMGVGDHRSRAHGPDESLDLSELQRGAVAEAIALAELGNP